MKGAEVLAALDTLTVLVDTREQPGARFMRRVKQFGNWRREKLDQGDYSVEFTHPVSNEVVSFKDCVCIERKMNIDELCNCLGNQRKRFEAEMERAKAINEQMYWIIEDASWEDIYSGNYRSKLNPKALVAGILAWQTRYHLIVIFCKPNTTGQLVKDILYREVKEYLEGQTDE